MFVELVTFDPQRLEPVTGDPQGPTVMGRDDAFLLVMPDINLWNTYLQDELVRRYGNDTWAATGPTRWGRRADNRRYQLELDNDNRTRVAPARAGWCGTGRPWPRWLPCRAGTSCGTGTSWPCPSAEGTIAAGRTAWWASCRWSSPRQ